MMNKNPDFVISVGGDGILLRAIHQYMNQVDTIRFVGIHTGTLGFFSSYDGDECEAFIQDLINKRLECKELPLLDICVQSQKGMNIITH